MTSLPKEFDINQVKDFSELDIEELRVPAYGNTSVSSSGNKKIEFRLPRNAFLHGAESDIICNVACGTTGKIHDWSESWLDQVVIKCGNLEIVRETNGGFFRSLVNNARYEYNDRTSASGKVRGSDGTIFDSMHSASRKVRIPLYDTISKWGVSPIFADLLPLYKMDQVKIELHLNNNLTEYTEGATAADSFTADNFELLCRLIDSPSLRAQYNKDIVRNFSSYSWHQDTLISGSSRIASVVPASFQNMTGLIVCSRASSVVNDGTVADKYQGQFDLNSVTEGALRIDGTQMPSNKYNYTDSVENVMLLERFWQVKSLGSYHDYSDDGASNDSKQYLVFPFESSKDAITGLNTASKTGTIVCDISCTASANQNLDFFIMYNAFYRISANGAISVSK